MKSVIVFCAIILGTGQAAAVVKDCGELKSDIAVKLAAAGIFPSVFAIVDKDWSDVGNIVGSCENGTKRIVRIPAATSAPRTGQADAPLRPSASLAYGVKNCEELKSEIAAKLAAAGIFPSVLAIVDKDWAGVGNIVGSCENGTKRIVRIPAAGSVSGDGQAGIPSRSSVTLAYGVKDCEELEFEIAAKLAAAGISPSVLDIVDNVENIVGSCENGTKRIVRIPAAGSVSGDGQAGIPSRSSVTLAYGVKDCEELKSEIAAKLVAAGVSSFFLTIVNKDWTGGGKVLGSCENGTKKIIRQKGTII